jgi:cell wall-associated protease
MPSVEKALAYEAFDRYRGNSYTDGAASIVFPLDRTATYYIKAEAYPMQ